MKKSQACFLIILLCMAGARVGLAAPPPKTPIKEKPTAVAAWPRLDDAEQAKAVIGLKDYAEATAVQLDCPLRMFETKFFLFYSDLPEQQAQNWAGLLDKMYARLAEMFDVQKGENIWRGKALVFVFTKAQTYRKYEKEMLHTDPGISAGMCHSSPNGFVRIAFYRQPDDGNFAHVLVHESVHGFIHRFRTPVSVPSWANEGLAETVATELVPQKNHREQVKNSARSQLKFHDNQLADFFDAEHIDGSQYPVAEMFCTFMIQTDRQKYAEFIRGIKDGINPEDSMGGQFKTTPQRMVQAFGQWLGIRNLKE